MIDNPETDSVKTIVYDPSVNNRGVNSLLSIYFHFRWLMGFFTNVDC